MANFKTIWLSDVHLGSTGCQAEILYHFLDNSNSDNLILVGDIIDFWALRRKAYWPQTHNNVVQKVLKKAKKGTKVIYIPGNHDETLRDYLSYTFGSIEMHREYIYESISGRSILCLHGDDFDVVTRYHKWIARLGDVGYDFLLLLNRHFNAIRAKMGVGFWSLSAFIKHKVKQAVNFIGDYEENVAKEAKLRNVDAVLCGHIHHLNMSYNETLYMNTSDWVETCGGIVEHFDGTIETFTYNIHTGMTIHHRLLPNSNEVEIV